MKLTSTSTVLTLTLIFTLGVVAAHPVDTNNPLTSSDPLFSCPTRNTRQSTLVQQMEDAIGHQLFCFYGTGTANSRTDSSSSSPSFVTTNVRQHDLLPPLPSKRETSCVYDSDSGRFLPFVRLSTTTKKLCRTHAIPRMRRGGVAGGMAGGGRDQMLALDGDWKGLEKHRKLKLHFKGLFRGWF